MAKSSEHDDKLAKLVEVAGKWFSSYFVAIETLCTREPDKVAVLREFGLVGQYDLVITGDGVVLCRLNGSEGLAFRILVRYFDSFDDAINNGPVLLFQSPDGRVRHFPFISVGPGATGMQIDDNLLSDADGTVYRQVYQHTRFLSWEYLKQHRPVVAALASFEAVFIGLRAGIPPSTSEAPASGVVERLEELLQEFRQLIESNPDEEIVQKFLALHPYFIWWEYDQVSSKFKLGSEYVTDFVFMCRGLFGPEHIFCEIEKPTKRLFTNKDILSAEFTQAEDQLRNWKRWIQLNLSYLKQNLPKLSSYRLHLIIGRGPDLTDEQRAKLQDRGGEIQISTYDDIISNLEIKIARFRELASG